MADTGTGTIEISGIPLSIVIDDMVFTGVTLNGTDRTSLPFDLGDPWIATDPSGSGDGWKLRIRVTDFVEPGESHTIPWHYTYSGADQYLFKMNIDSIVSLDGHNIPTTGAGQPGDMPYVITGVPDWTTLSGLQDIDQTFISADVAEGMGRYEIQPDFFLDIPAETYVGSYTSTMTVTISTGP